ncbi:O-antigen ligase family protein [Agrococcus lahaulensis]|uniref:O-antigen ligase family protein n=1 Tax=Agrococcus lahaulensis TaxID=341722 RepID=UPI00047B3A15|nr:O-antigen ligase family protein [Agrococcus lahaulensis]
MLHQRRRAALATWVVVNAAAGDAVRNVIGYPAWGVLVVATFIWVSVELVLLRVRLSRVPTSIALFSVLAVASASWAISPSASLLGSVGLLGMVASAIFIAALPYRLILDVFHWSLQGLLLASLLFELLVSLTVDGPLFPLWSDYPPGTTAEFSWSSGLLLHGGRIQGVMGNANLLAMLALVALVVATCRAVAGLDRRWPLWVLMPVVMLALARSATVAFALLAVAIIGGLIVVWVRWRGATFYRVFAIVIAAGLVAIGLIIANWAHVAEFLNRDADLTGRFDIWGRVVDLALSSPVVGVGYLGYWQPWVPPFDVLGRVGDVAYLQAHNVWLDVFMQLGMVGVILWAAMQWRAMVNCLGAMYRSRPEEYAMNAAPLLLWVAFFVQGLAESRPWIEYGMILLLIFTIGRRRREIVPRAPETVAISTVR